MGKYMVTWKGGEFNLWNYRYFEEEREALSFYGRLESVRKEIWVKDNDYGYNFIGGIYNG